MSTKKSLNVSLLFFLVIIFMAGCGGGGSSSSATDPATSGNESATTVNNTEVGGTSGGTISTGVAKLAWDAPVNADGTTFTAFAGYKIYYGTSPKTYNSVINVGMTTNYSVNGLAPGTYYFAVTIYDTSGNESGYSNETKKAIL